MKKLALFLPLVLIAVIYFHKEEKPKINFSSVDVSLPKVEYNSKGEIVNAADLLRNVEWETITDGRSKYSKKSTVVWTDEPFILTNMPRAYKGECLLEARLLRGIKSVYKDRTIYYLKPNKHTECVTVGSRIEN